VNEKLEVAAAFLLCVFILPAGIYYLMLCQRHIEE